MCQIFSRSVLGLRSSDTPKLPFPIDLLRRPYNSVALPYDTVMTAVLFLGVYITNKEIYKKSRSISQQSVTPCNVHQYLTRNSAIADKPRDAFRGQSRSRLPNMVPLTIPYVRYGFLLVYSYSNFVRVRGPSRLKYSTSKML